MASLSYEIRVAGVLSAEALLDYDRLDMAQEVETVLLGPLPDQAALRKLLARLEVFGVQVREIRRVTRVLPSQPVRAGEEKEAAMAHYANISDHAYSQPS